MALTITVIEMRWADKEHHVSVKVTQFFCVSLCSDIE